MGFNENRVDRIPNDYLLVIMLSILLMVFTVVQGIAGDNKGLVGWEMNSAYNKLYNPEDTESFKGKIKDIVEVVPLEGMAPGIALIVNDSGENVTVHVGPASYVKPKSLGVRKGDKVKVRGVWIEINGKDAFILAKLKKGDDFSYKVRRTSDGRPWWTMTAAEIQKEKSGQ